MATIAVLMNGDFYNNKGSKGNSKSSEYKNENGEVKENVILSLKDGKVHAIFFINGPT